MKAGIVKGRDEDLAESQRASTKEGKKNFLIKYESEKAIPPYAQRLMFQDQTSSCPKT